MASTTSQPFQLEYLRMWRLSYKTVWWAFLKVCQLKRPSWLSNFPISHLSAMKGHLYLVSLPVAYPIQRVTSRPCILSESMYADSCILRSYIAPAVFTAAITSLYLCVGKRHEVVVDGDFDTSPNTLKASENSNPWRAKYVAGGDCTIWHTGIIDETSNVASSSVYNQVRLQQIIVLGHWVSEKVVLLTEVLTLLALYHFLARLNASFRTIISPVYSRMSSPGSKFFVAMIPKPRLVVSMILTPNFLMSLFFSSVWNARLVHVSPKTQLDESHSYNIALFWQSIPHLSSSQAHCTLSRDSFCFILCPRILFALPTQESSHYQPIESHIVLITYFFSLLCVSRYVVSRLGSWLKYLATLVTVPNPPHYHQEWWLDRGLCHHYYISVDHEMPFLVEEIPIYDFCIKELHISFLSPNTWNIEH